MYYTEDGIKITERIKDGRTVVFDTEKSAKEYARKKGSYSQPVYKKKKSENRLLAGYGVPK